MRHRTTRRADKTPHTQMPMTQLRNGHGTEPASPTRRRRYDLMAALLIAGALAVYLLNVGAYFLSDDFVLLAWTRTTAPGGVAGFFDPHVAWFYRPLVKLVYWGGQSLFGLHAAPFHILSVLLHGANGFLVYRLVAGSSRRNWAAGLASALIFILDPHHAETVSWISAVGDLIGAICMLGSLLLFRRFTEEHSTTALVMGLVLFATGLLARETVALLPGLLLLYVLATGIPRAYRRRTALAIGTYMPILALYFLLQRSTGAGLARGGLEFHMLNSDSLLLGVLDYAHRLVPGGELLANAPLQLLQVTVWIEWLLIIAGAVAMYRLKRRVALFGLAWMLLAPFAFVFFSPPTDRYFYLPSIGFAVFAGALLTDLSRLARRVNPGREGPLPQLAGLLIAAAAAVLIVGHGVALAGKVGTWSEAGRVSGGVLHDMTVAVQDPNSYSAFYFVDLPLFSRGVPVFQNGLQEAVQGAYSNTTIAAHIVSCSDLQVGDLPRYSFFFRYKERGLQLLSSRTSCLK